MFPNSPLPDRHPLLRSADALLGALTIAGLGLAATLVGLIFVGLLPIIGAVLLIAVVVCAR